MKTTLEISDPLLRDARKLAAREGTTVRALLDQFDACTESPTLVLLAESERYWIELRSVITASRVAGARIHDARVAALCRHHGVRELWSADRDFSRFADLKIVNPLIR